MTLLSEFAARRKRLLEQLPADSIAVIAAAPEVYRNGDAHYFYRQDSDFYYLTGFNEPEAVAVFIPGRAEGQFLLFNRVKDPSKEVWTGYYAGQEGAVSCYGADEAFPITELDERIILLLANKKSLYYPFSTRSKLPKWVRKWFQQLQEKAHRVGMILTEYCNLEAILHEMRLIKSPWEQEKMRQSAAIAAVGHRRAMTVCRPGLTESALQAEIEYEFRKNGAIAPAYTSIVGGGANACILHYVENTSMLRDGELVLIDAGCEYDFYASDITRTFPVNGKFTPAQRAIYELVLNTQLALIERVKPGLPHAELQSMTLRLLTQGLIELGLIQGSLEEALKQKAYLPFYMHNVSHWLGMDVHDSGRYRIAGESRLLEPGMVLTIEPGLYIAPDNLSVDPKWRGIGIRIEDDVLVTDTGYEVLSAGAPKALEEIESLRC